MSGEALIIAAVVLAAAAYLTYLAWRRLTGKRGCSACEKPSDKKKHLDITVGGKRL